jgi:hypothetical protein
MKDRHGRSLALAVLLAVGACARGPEATDATVPSPAAPSDPSPTPTIQDVTELELGDFPPLEPGTYFIDPDADPSTPSGWCMRSPSRDGRRGSARPSSPKRDGSR